MSERHPDADVAPPVDVAGLADMATADGDVAGAGADVAECVDADTRDRGGEPCPPERPYRDDGGECAVCLEDAHCQAIFGEEYICASHGCVPSPDCRCLNCVYCAAPYPACTPIDGIWSCVQCTDDSHCEAPSTCDTLLHACTHPGGDPPFCAMCLSDADCVSFMGLSLSCDANTGLCYDPVEGLCDDVEVCCKGGLPCRSLGGLVGPLGRIPTPVAPFGTCSCTDPIQEMSVLMACVAGECPASVDCVNGACVDEQLLLQLAGLPTSGGPSPTGLCIVPSTLEIFQM